jgi:hypothetical protein
MCPPLGWPGSSYGRKRTTGGRDAGYARNDSQRGNSATSQLSLQLARERVRVTLFGRGPRVEIASEQLVHEFAQFRGLWVDRSVVEIKTPPAARQHLFHVDCHSAS